MKNKEKKIIAEFRELFIPKNKTGNISMKRYLGICKGIEKFLLRNFSDNECKEVNDDEKTQKDES